MGLGVGVRLGLGLELGLGLGLGFGFGPVDRDPVGLAGGDAGGAVADVGCRAQVGGRELVKLGPALRHVGAPLLQHGVEPREHEEQLRARRAAALEVVAVQQRLEGALQVLLQPGRRLVRVGG